VGGTVLTMSGNGVAWSSETAWGGSGGGLSSYGLPDWQEGIATVANQASTLWRNYPDVAMPAVNIFTVYENGTIVGGTAGTSAASPLWAGFMALVNQQAAAAGKPPVGFINRRFTAWAWDRAQPTPTVSTTSPRATISAARSEQLLRHVWV